MIAAMRALLSAAGPSLDEILWTTQTITSDSAPTFRQVLRITPRIWAWLALGGISGVMLVVVSVGIYLLLRLWKRRRQLRGTNAAAALGPTTLLKLWTRFLERLPRSVRALVGRYPAVVVLGPAGSGKSQVIRTFIDWQGQSSQFLPSLVESSLAQIYLGNRIVVEEIGAPILYNNEPVVAQSLEKLWAPLCRERAPMALITLKLSMLESASPEERSLLGHQLRGKLALLGKLVGAPVEARLVLTHMEQVRGFIQFARFCTGNQLPVTLPLAGATNTKDVIDAAEELNRYLPIALTKLPASEYREVVLFLKEVPRLAEALDGFLKPLVEWNVSSHPPTVERLYLYTSADGAQGSNPFAGRKVQPILGFGARIKALLPPSLRGSQWHLIAAFSLVILTLSICIGSAVRHGRAIRRASDAVETFAQAVHRAQATLGDVRESPAVRSASHAAREAIEIINVTENTWILHRILYRGSKTVIKDKLLETIRNAYFLPLIPRFGAQRDTERMLHTLAVVYAARDNALGSLVNSELRDIASSLAISDAVISDYVQLSDVAWAGAAAVPWNRLSSGPPPGTAQAEAWLRYFRELQQAYRVQGVTPEQLRKLQAGAVPLLRVADAVRGKRKLAQILNAIAEESPLVEIEQRIGSHHPELAPQDWLRDQQVAISGILHLVHDTDQSAVHAGQMSLVQVLRLLTDLDERKRNEDHVYQFEIGENSFSFSQRAWADMLLRGRNQLVLGALYKASDLTASGSAASSVTAGSSSEAGSFSGSSDRRRHHRAKARDEDPEDNRSPLPNSDGKRASEGNLESDRVAAADPNKESHGSHRRRHNKPHERHHRRERHGKGGRGVESELAESERRSRPVKSPNAAVQVSAAEAGQYNRASYEQTMKSLLQKLDKALGDDSGLPGPQRQYLTRYVQEEARRYAEKYCAALLVQHRGYVFPGGALSSTRAALLDLVTPTGSLLNHLKVVTDNANLSGLDGRFTQPLLACLNQLKPLTTVMTASKDGGYPGLKPYADVIAAIVKELDTGKQAEVKEDGKVPALAELLTPLGRIGLTVLAEQEASPERKVELFLESAGMAGPLAPPFLAPVQHLTRLGLTEVEQSLNQQWESTLLPMVRPLLSRYPFERRGDRETQAIELDVLKPAVGAFWQTFRQVFGPVCVEQGGVWSPRKWARGSLVLPNDMLPLVNQLAQLTAALFTRDGARKPLVINIKPLPVQACDAENPATVSFLTLGKSQVFGTNTRPAALAFSLPWWQQEISTVGVEFGKGASQRATQSIEIADSQWSFFRLLERATSSRGVYTWVLPSDGGRPQCEVRFELENDPAALFRIKSR